MTNTTPSNHNAYWLPQIIPLIFLTLFASAATGQQQLNPNFFYYVNGEIIDGWSIQVSDEDDWGGVKTENFKARSAGGKVVVSPADYVEKGDAVRVEWKRKDKRGQFAIYGPHIDLSPVKDAAALAFDLKVERAPNKGVDIAMDCGWPCRAQFNIAQNLRKAPKNQWFTMPIPLNCFSGEEFDFSKINGPLLLSTEGRLEIVITNIRVQRLPEGETGCAEES